MPTSPCSNATPRWPADWPRPLPARSWEPRPMPDVPPTEEQLRRLKNTVMGAAYRLSELARLGDLHAGAATELASISRDLNEAVGRLERLLATLQRDR